MANDARSLSIGTLRFDYGAHGCLRSKPIGAGIMASSPPRIATCSKLSFGSFTVFRQGCAPYELIAAKAQCSRSRVCAAALVPFEEAVRKEIRHRAFGFPKSEAA